MKNLKKGFHILKMLTAEIVKANSTEKKKHSFLVFYMHKKTETAVKHLRSLSFHSQQPISSDKTEYLPYSKIQIIHKV